MDVIALLLQEFYALEDVIKTDMAEVKVVPAKKKKSCPYQAVEAHLVVRRRGSHIFYLSLYIINQTPRHEDVWVVEVKLHHS
jgi:hypothetical protein